LNLITSSLFVTGRFAPDCVLFSQLLQQCGAPGPKSQAFQIIYFSEKHRAIRQNDY
jgi:hypothetical protein